MTFNTMHYKDCYHNDSDQEYFTDPRIKEDKWGRITVELPFISGTFSSYSDAQEALRLSDSERSSGYNQAKREIKEALGV